MIEAQTVSRGPRVAPPPATQPGDVQAGSPRHAPSRRGASALPAQNATGNAAIAGSRRRTIADHRAAAATVDERRARRARAPQRNAGAATPRSWERAEAALDG